MSQWVDIQLHDNNVAETDDQTIATTWCLPVRLNKALEPQKKGDALKS